MPLRKSVGKDHSIIRYTKIHDVKGWVIAYLVVSVTKAVLLEILEMI